MPYSDFTIKRVQTAFQVEIIEKPGLFASIEPREPSPYLLETLAENVFLATAINTEKARSELIIAPVLVEIRKQFGRAISLFSGIELNVDKDRDLTGFCDFIIGRSPEQLFLKAPIIAIVEAKNENIMSGVGQCLAEMIAARIFNEKEGVPAPRIYGAITSGNLWRFAKLEENAVFIDLDDYGIKEIARIIGILKAMVEQAA
jgi:hypothetical protein